MSGSRVAYWWLAPIMGALVLSVGCATVTPSAGPRVLSEDVARENTQTPRRPGGPVRVTTVSLVNPTDLGVRTLTGGIRQTDAFESLLLLAGLNEVRELAPREAPVTPREAVRLLTVLLRTPVTRGSFPSRMAVCHLLREVLAGGEVSRGELLHRVDRFKTVAVLRPDGYLAWTLTGRTQQKVGPVEWNEGSFRAGSFELGRFYAASGWVFRPTDARLNPLVEGPPLAEVYDDADLIGRSLDGAQEALVDLYHTVGQLLTHPLDSVAALQHLPAGVAALIASSPESLERFRFMTRGEQIKAVSKLTTQLLVTFGTAGGVTSTLTRATGGLEAIVPELSMSLDGLLTVERVVIPVGKAATTLGGGPGAAIILQMAGRGRGDGGAAMEYEHMAPDGSGITATLDETGVVDMVVEAPKGSSLRGTELFRGMMEHFGASVRAIRGNWRYGDNLAEVNKLVKQNMPLEMAVTKTWTARRAAEYGFTKAAVIETTGSPGAYSFIKVLFTR